MNVCTLHMHSKVLNLISVQLISMFEDNNKNLSLLDLRQVNVLRQLITCADASYTH